MKREKIAIFVLSFLLFAKTASAQYDGISIPTDSITPSPTSSPQVIHYDLPYPGILPGNPVYTLKVVRDKMVEILTTDPSKKTAFYLLQADKRLAASLLLFDSGDYELGESTLSKSQNYLEKSIDQAKKAKEVQKNVDDTVAKIKASSKKQVNEINMLLENDKGGEAEKLKADLERAKMLEKSAESLD